MKKATMAWEEIAKWVIVLALLIALIVLVIIFSGGTSAVWEKIASVLRMGA